MSSAAAFLRAPATSRAAAPAGIPESIYMNETPHVVPIARDGGLQFELDHEKARQFGVEVLDGMLATAPDAGS